MRLYNVSAEKRHTISWSYAYTFQAPRLQKTISVVTTHFEIPLSLYFALNATRAIYLENEDDDPNQLNHVQSLLLLCCVF